MAAANPVNLDFHYERSNEKHRCCCLKLEGSRCNRMYYKMYTNGTIYICWQHLPIYLEGRTQLCEEVRRQPPRRQPPKRQPPRSQLYTDKSPRKKPRRQPPRR